jgi:hypothetical protein
MLYRGATYYLSRRVQTPSLLWPRPKADVEHETHGRRSEPPGRIMQTRLHLHVSWRAAKFERVGEYRRERESHTIDPLGGVHPLSTQPTSPNRSTNAYHYQT